MRESTASGDGHRDDMSVRLFAEATDTAPGLRMRPWTLPDAPALEAAHDDPQSRQWLNSVISGPDGARQWIEEQLDRWSKGIRYSFAVLECPDDGTETLVGHVVVKMASEFSSAAAEMGYWTTATARGRGIASRALVAASQWIVTSDATLERLELIHAVDNPASCRVAVKAGYVLDAVLPAQSPTYPGPGHLHILTTTPG